MKNKPSYQIRQATLDDAKKIERFLNIAYGHRACYKYPLLWLWEYANNPFWKGAGLPVWIAESDGAIVGQACVMATQLKLGEHLVNARWGTDFIVLPDYRKSGIGTALLDTLTRDSDVFVALSMAPFTMRALKALGFQEIDPVAVLYKKLDSRSLSKFRQVRENACDVTSKTFLSFGKKLFSQLSYRRKGGIDRIDKAHRGKISFESVDHFGPEFDSLWDELSSSFFAVVPRNSTYLNWKFCEQPHIKYQRIAARCEGNLKGYCIFRWGLPPEAAFGIISDVLVDPTDKYLLTEIISYALGVMAEKDLKGVFVASSYPAYVECFRNLGFDKFEERKPLFRAQGDSARVIQGIPRGWFLSRSDHDWDQYLSLMGVVHE